MNEHPAETTEVIRLLFELERADNPRLYDDLIRFNKGTKRVNRLRTLAQEGLLVQQMQKGLVEHVLESHNGRPQDADEPVRLERNPSAILNQVFEAPISE